MKSIRIGNDIFLEWIIKRNGEAEIFDGKEVTITLLDYHKEEQPIDYSIRNNVVYIDFLGKDQKKLGLYTLVLCENKGKVDMSTVDFVQAFRLVEHSYMENGEDLCPTLKVEHVKLESDIAVGNEIIVIDSLKSESKKDALSANQGRVLDEKINQTNKKIPYKVSDLRNDLLFTKKEYVDEVNRIQNKDLLDMGNSKQDTLISGTNIKTINGESILGEGNISVSGGSGEGYSINVVDSLTSNSSTDALSAKQGKELKVLVDERVKTIDYSRDKNTFALKSELPKLDGYAKEEWVNQQGFLKSIPDNYATDKEVNAAVSTKQDTLVSGVNIATINNQDITKGGNIDITGGGGEITTNNYGDLMNKPQIGGVELNGNKTLKELGLQAEGDYAEKKDIPSLVGYAKEEWVNQQNFLKEVPTEYITEQELLDKSYLTEIPSDYAKKSDIKTDTNQLNNGAGFITNTKNAFDYVNLKDAPTIPTDNNQIGNSAGYITNEALNDYAKTSQIPNVSNKADKIKVVNGGNGNVTKTINSNTFYEFGECANIKLTLAADAEGIYDEYMFEFKSGQTPTTLDLPSVIKWMKAPKIQANKTYQVSIVNNLAIIGEF